MNEAGLASPARDAGVAEARLADFTYALPREAIASRPPPDRAAARLLVLDRESGAVEHTRFAELGRFLERGDCLVLNETRVIPARLHGVRPETGGRVELLLIRRHPGGDGGKTEEVWEALGKPGKRLLPGVRLELAAGAIEARVLSTLGPGRRLLALCAGDRAVGAALEDAGRMPIPPYLGRRDDARDRQDYQTVFARVPGSVAAPTAGLHFTTALLAQLARAGIEITRLVLHVGPGTFQPLGEDDLARGTLETERLAVPPETARVLEQTRARGGRIVAVGTTSVRALETRAGHSRGRIVTPGEGSTDLFIRPPFEFRVVDGLITNFHLPGSSLLMLVAAFAGRRRILDAYEEAVRRGYLFYSYGDAMLIV